MQWYEYVPAVANDREYVPPAVLSPEFASLNVTLCVAASGAHVQVTVAPVETTIAPGVN